jgi:hypothetical protein
LDILRTNPPAEIAHDPGRNIANKLKIIGVARWQTASRFDMLKDFDWFPISIPRSPAQNGALVCLGHFFFLIPLSKKSQHRSIGGAPIGRPVWILAVWLTGEARWENLLERQACRARSLGAKRLAIGRENKGPRGNHQAPALADPCGSAAAILRPMNWIMESVGMYLARPM